MKGNTEPSWRDLWPPAADATARVVRHLPRRPRDPSLVTCPRGCCATYKEHIRSLGLRPSIPSPKVTRHDTDTAIVTETEHWQDRQDTHVALREAPVQMTVPQPTFERLKEYA